MQFLVKKSYSYVRFVGDDGDYDEEHGWIDEGTLLSLRDTVEELSRYPEASSCPLTPESCWFSWLSRRLDGYDCTEGDRGDWEGGEESIHVYRANGEWLPARQLYRLYRLAGLIDR